MKSKNVGILTVGTIVEVEETMVNARGVTRMRMANGWTSQKTGPSHEPISPRSLSTPHSPPFSSRFRRFIRCMRAYYTRFLRNMRDKVRTENYDRVIAGAGAVIMEPVEEEAAAAPARLAPHPTLDMISQFC